ncbi:FkbM family methyltransferase [Roseococcus sp. SDR]|uniref:FkbM family methyltransferase n=1 Tax=Roseococcus sp. SDR TaxID=2835532 RepID=UPI001BCFF31E|nr:FkbM family methyltransferase [Roseococcus sp. SDR]MBS7791090.1 FkbM family methyltransferase [Roseococcus sp. SDR]MBV1846404.1 FkbM family methyltransferase [Roseococcus sp. SDR]
MDRTGTQISYVEAVRWAYRFLLGREAESEAVLAHWASLQDGRLILNYFVRSSEAESHMMAGAPAYGTWAHSPLGASAIRAAWLLRFNTTPTDTQIQAELAAHADLLSYRRAFLAAPELRELAEQLPWGRPEAPATAPAPSAPPVIALRDHTLTVLDRSFRLRGDGEEGYWNGLVAGPVDPSLERLARLLRAAFPDGGAGRVLADAGANIGVTSLVMGAAAPYHAELLCFEPDERNLPLLRHNLDANDFPQARVLDCALAERDGVARLRCGTRNAATSALAEAHSRTQTAGAVFRQVPVRRLDSVLAELGIERLDFLKLDIEGGETPAILGASEALARDRAIVFTEFNTWTQMTAGARNPMEVLEEWHAAFRHLVAFGPDGRPLPIVDHDGLLWVLHTVLTERNCVDDLILCDDLDWLERWE